MDANEFVDDGPASHDTVLAFSVGFPLSNASGVFAELAARSRPNSSTYGAWLPQSNISELLAPSELQRAAARDTLTNASCVNMPAGLRCNATVAAVNSIFNTTLHTYKRIDAAGAIIGVVQRVPPNISFSLPSNCAVAFATALLEFPSMSRRLGSMPMSVDVDGRRLANDYYTTPGVDEPGAGVQISTLHCYDQL